MVGPSVVRRYVTLEKLTAHNEIAGFKFATVGVLYAVLLAFAIIVVWEKFSAAETNRRAGGRRRGNRLSAVAGSRRQSRRRSSRRCHPLSRSCHRRRLAGHGAGGDRRQPIRAAGAERYLHRAADIRDGRPRRQSGRDGNPVSARPDDAGTPGEAGRRGRHRARRLVARPVRRRGRDHRFHFLLRHAKSAGADHDDGPLGAAHLFGATDHRFDRPAFHRDGQGEPGGAGRGA